MLLALRTRLAKVICPEAFPVVMQRVASTVLPAEQHEPVLDYHTHLIELSAAYAKHLNLSHWRVSFLVRGDGHTNLH